MHVEACTTRSVRKKRMQFQIKENTSWDPELTNILISELAQLSGLPPKEIDAEEPIIHLGLDSLLAADLNTRMIKKLGVGLPYDLIAGGGNLKELAHYVSAHVERDPSKGYVLDSTVSQKLSSTGTFSPLESGSIRNLPEYVEIFSKLEYLKENKIEETYARVFDAPSSAEFQHEGKSLINFASYNYLGLNHHPLVNQAAIDAIQAYGTSVCSSRIVSGEKPVHQKLESLIAKFYGVESALVFVSGYVTNTTVISHIMGKGDLIIHDALAHNSIVNGSLYSNAKRLIFPHNDMEKLEILLKENHTKFNKILIVVEGLYSMDGDTAPLTELVRLKNSYKVMLMVDEAHSIGVLGNTGRGLSELYGVDPNEVDIWMGTLSKSLASCGGYIAGCAELTKFLRYSAPGFVFSVGLSPPLAAASAKALELLIETPSLVKKLHENSASFLAGSRKNQLNVGLSEGYGIVPIMIGCSSQTLHLANELLAQGVSAQPIVYPAVEELGARLRFFISSDHTNEQIDWAINSLKELISKKT